ncbi:type II toxin-antitoxin system HicA family toxin [Microcystis aeruginosa]|uniref:type II toxin-antitoxin system HicA family toxin n=1 Tax=Microcystis aeruginosa TaxID=1126 RepID=UPI00287F942F|nr:type II toxin-antitoxin system HicA family toxin [Microcystis aeruginosa]WNF12912.1 type II toxin-antitoxin system HicA family toxin [Microcystis aeruginosa NRERC-214]
MRYKELAQKLRRLGCEEIERKSKGSHRKWLNLSNQNVAVIPDWGSKDLKFGTIKATIKPTFRTLSCHREKLRREKIKVSIKINIRSEKRHLRNSKAPKMASKPILNKEQ